MPGVFFLGFSFVGAGLILAPYAWAIGGFGTDGPVCSGLALQLCVLVAALSALAFDRYKRAVCVYLAIATAFLTLFGALWYALSGAGMLHLL